MASLKIAVFGAGSFVFGPSVLKGVYLERKLKDLHLALVDLDREALDLMAGVAKRLARETGIEPTISTHTDRREALDGSSFVLTAVAQQIRKRHAMDCAEIRKHAPREVPTEFGGIAGISYSLRQIALLSSIGADVKRFCPQAHLLNMANPLPRVCQALHEDGLKVTGFCSASYSGYSMAWWALRGDRLQYPFGPAREAWHARFGGLNHFAWLLELRDRSSGADLLPELARRAERLPPLTARLFREAGYLLMPGDGHIRDFLEPVPETPRDEHFAHGSGEERQARLEALRAVAEDRAPYEPLFAHESWEKPVDLVAALSGNGTASFEALNLPNAGQLPGVPDGVYVETPAAADASGVKTETTRLPEQPLALCQRTAHVTTLIVRAARERSFKRLREAVEADPVIVDKQAGWRALQGCLDAHADVLPKLQ